MGSAARSQERSAGERARRARPRLVALFLAVAFGIGVIAYVTVARARDRRLKEEGHELRAIVDLKASQIEAWRAERLGDGRAVAEDPLLVQAVGAWLAAGAPAEGDATLRLRLRSLLTANRYERISLLDAGGGLRLTEPSTPLSRGEAGELGRQALPSAGVSIFGLHRPDPSEGIYLGLVAPLRLTGGSGARPVAFVVFKIDPNHFLYPLVQSWPTPSRSAETLLVRREGNEVVYLNELRHRTGAALTLRFPLTQASLPAALAIQGHEGVVEGIDYRGQRVLAAMRRVPDSPWFLVSKIDREELVAPLAPEAWLTALLALALVSLAGLGVLLLERREREASGAELRESALRYRRLFEAAKDGILILDAETAAIVDVNPFLCDLLGLSREEVLGRKLWEIGPFKDVLASKVDFPQLQTTEYIRYEDLPLETARGDKIAVEFVSNVYRANGGKVIQCNVRDITERKLAEEALAREQRLLNELITTIPDNIYFKDRDSRFLKINNSMAHWFGLSDPNHVVGKTDRDFFTEEHARQAYAEEQRVMEGGEPQVALEEKETWHDGSVTWVSTSKVPIRDASGQIVGLVGLSRDITKRKLAEEKQAKTEEQLRQSQKLEAVGRLAGGVAHDFNNMLGVIMGYGELMRRQIGEGHPARPRLEQVLKAAERAAGLTRQLLAFSRKQVMQPKLLDLNELVRDLKKMLDRVVGEDVEIELQAASNLGTVKADPTQIEQVLMNLVVNARDAMPKGGRLTIGTANVEFDEEYAALHPPMKPGRFVMLAVSDTGTGMDAETQQRVFEPFFTTKPAGEGTGLGLATVYGIVKQSGGYIWVYSEPGQGATFKIYLPSADEPAGAEAAPALTTVAPTGHETVLVVEDTESLREVIREVLEAQGYTVLLASQGEEALALVRARQGPIDLLLTDVVMPKLGGGELAMQAAVLRPGIRVLYMSGYTEGAILRQGTLLANARLLEKPFRSDKLARAVRAALDQPKPS